MVVELPEGATDVRESYANGFIYKLADGYICSWYADEDAQLDGTWQIVGMLPEVTEEQAGSMVQHKVWGQERGLYRNYLYHEIQARHIMKETALESLESAILAEGYYLDVNPIPVPDYSEGHVRFDETVEHAKAQSRVLSRERCLLLRRVEG